MNVFDDLAEFYDPFVTTYSFRGQLVDTEKYDVIPKPSYKQELLQKVEKDIETLDKDYKKERERLEEKKERLKNKDDG